MKIWCRIRDPFLERIWFILYITSKWQLNNWCKFRRSSLFELRDSQMIFFVIIQRLKLGSVQWKNDKFTLFELRVTIFSLFVWHSVWWHILAVFLGVVNLEEWGLELKSNYFFFNPRAYSRDRRGLRFCVIYSDSLCNIYYIGNILEKDCHNL